MKKQTIQISLRQSDNSFARFPIEGYAFECRGLSLVVHRDTFARGNPDHWTVSECESGAAVCHDVSRGYAVTKAREILESKTDAQIRTAINGAIARFSGFPKPQKKQKARASKRPLHKDQRRLVNRALRALERDELLGFCLECGADQLGVEPDARGDQCECCGAAAVYGAEEIIIREGAA